MPDEKKLSPTPGSTVRCVRTVAGRREGFFAVVLSNAPVLPENLGADNEPTISVAFLDPRNLSPNALTGVDWSKGFQRITGLRHATHDDAQAGLSEQCWVDVLPTDLSKWGDINDDVKKPALEAPKPGEEGHNRAVFHGNNLKIVPVGGDKFEVRNDQDEPVEVSEEEGGSAEFGSFEEAHAYIHRHPVRVANLAPVIPSVELTQQEAYKKEEGRKAKADADRRAEEAAAPALAAAVEGKDEPSEPSLGEDGEGQKVDEGGQPYIDSRTDDKVGAENPETNTGELPDGGNPDAEGDHKE